MKIRQVHCARARTPDPPASKEDLESSNLTSAVEASKKFKWAGERGSEYVFCHSRYPLLRRLGSD